MGEHGDLVDPEDFEGRARTDHVDDGVDPADLVEVDLVWWPAMEPAFGDGEGGEHGARPDAAPAPASVLRRRVPGCGRRCDHGGLGGVDVDLGTGDAAPQDRLGLELPLGHRQPLEQFLDLVEVGAGVDQRAQGHVAGHAGEAVEPCRGHGATPWSWRSPAARRTPVGETNMRATAHAAPYPLSMPTTVMPAAHDANIPRSAVTPSSPAP